MKARSLSLGMTWSYGGKLSVDQLDRDSDVVGLEDEVPLVDADCRGRLAGLDRPPQLDDPLARDEHAGRQLRASCQRVARLGEPVAVGGDHPGGGAVRLEQHAGQVLAGLVERDGEDRLGDHVPQRARLDGEGLRLGDGRKLGIVAVGKPDDLELDLAAADLRPVLLGPAHADLVVRQPLDDLVQLPRRHRQPALFLDLGGEGDLRADVQVRRAAEELVLAVRAQKDVRQDGERALSIGDPVRQVESPQELVLSNLELHPSLLELSRSLLSLIYKIIKKR